MESRIFSGTKSCSSAAGRSLALRRIGVGEAVVEYVMNSLKGTTLAMKTSIPGRITPAVEIHKAVKQGCPLAPLLFALVMDELHEGYRKIGGYIYKLQGGYIYIFFLLKSKYNTVSGCGMGPVWIPADRAVTHVLYDGDGPVQGPPTCRG